MRREFDLQQQIAAMRGLAGKADGLAGSHALGNAHAQGAGADGDVARGAVVGVFQSDGELGALILRGALEASIRTVEPAGGAAEQGRKEVGKIGAAGVAAAEAGASTPTAAAAETARIPAGRRSEALTRTPVGAELVVSLALLRIAEDIVASLASLNLSSAPLALFLSGWYCRASLR